MPIVYKMRINRACNFNFDAFYLFILFIYFYLLQIFESAKGFEVSFGQLISRPFNFYLVW